MEKFKYGSVSSYVTWWSEVISFFPAPIRSRITVLLGGSSRTTDILMTEGNFFKTDVDRGV